MVNRFNFYLLRLVLKPLLVTLGIVAMLLILERMLRLFDLVVNEGGPFMVVWQMLATVMPHYVGLAVPAAIFLGVLFAFRKISGNSEIDAMQASGLGLHSMIKPALGISALFALFYFLLVGYWQPHNWYTYRALLYDLRQGAFGASIKVGEFNSIGKNVTMRIGTSRNQGSELLDVFISRERADGHITTVSAREGSFLSTEDDNIILLRLRDGELADWESPQDWPKVLRFTYYDWPIRLPEIPEFRKRGETAGAGERELTLNEIWAMIGGMDDDERAKFQAVLHGRLTRSFGILFLPFLAAPLGFLSKRSAHGFGTAFGIILLLGFHKVLEFGESMVHVGQASPWAALWLPQILFAAFSFWIFYVTAFQVGRNPLAALERGWAGAIEFVTALPGRLIARRRTSGERS